MINITREKEVPKSLDTPEIQDYIQKAIAYKKDPKNKEKPTPPSSYRNSDLLDAFDRCFYAKCYLTEEKFINSYTMDVEHFIPKSEAPELRYEWTNLFPAEHNANMSKPNKTPEGGYLNPCDPADDVEKQIIYTLSALGERPFFDPIDKNNLKEVNTTELLDRLHNGHDENSIRKTADLRNAIQKKYINLYQLIAEYGLESISLQRKTQIKNELKGLLSRRASFTMLCRSIPAVIQLNKELSNELFD